MQHADSVAVSANFVLMGVGILLSSFGFQKMRYYTASTFLMAAVVGSIHLSKFDIKTSLEWIEDVSIVVCLLLVVLGMANYARLQLREEGVDAQDAMRSGGNGPSHLR
jgi:hypothetical protein